MVMFVPDTVSVTVCELDTAAEAVAVTVIEVAAASVPVLLVTERLTVGEPPRKFCVPVPLNPLSTHVNPPVPQPSSIGLTGTQFPNVNEGGFGTEATEL